MLLTNAFTSAWGLGAGKLKGIEIAQSPANANIGLYGWRSIGVPSITISSGGFGIAYLTAVNTDANRANAECLWIRQVKADGSPAYRSGALVRGSGTAGAENGYFCYVDEASSLLTIAKIVSGTLTTISTSAVTLPTAVEDHLVRFRVNGTALKAKFWRYDAPEPTAWAIDTTDSSISAAGFIGPAFECLSANNAGFHVPGFFSVGTNGETAQLPRSDPEIRNWVNNDNPRVLLFEIGVLGQLADGTANPSTILVSTWPFITKGSDTPPNQVYDDIVVKAPVIRATANEQLMGRSTLTYGDLVVSNEDGARDHWLAWNTDGLDCVGYLGGVGWRMWDFFRIHSGTVQEVYAPARDEIGFKIRDKGAVLDRKLQSAVMGGSEADAGAPQPITFGKVFNIEPVLEASATLTYRFTDGDLTGATGITQVRDKGQSVSFTADLPNGKFTLNSSPAGRVTLDVTNDLTASSAVKSGNTHRRALQTIVEDRVGLGTGATYQGNRSGSLANFATAADIGLYVRSEANVLNVLDDVAISAGGFWYFDALGIFCASQLRVPDSPYDHDLLEDDLLDDLQIEKILLPAEAEQLGFQENWTQQPDGLADGVSAANKALYGAAAQFTTIAPAYSGLDQPANHVLRRRLNNRATLFRNSSDAITEAARLDAISRKSCAIVRFTTKYNGPFYELGQSLRLTHSKFGFENGKAGIIMSFEKDFESAETIIRLFVQLDGQFPQTTVAVPIVGAEDFYPHG